jgi:hypothetical protein
MRSRQRKLRPVFRWLTAVTLFVWLGAQALCQTQCLFEDCHGESNNGHHASEIGAGHHADEHDPQPGDPQDNTEAACLTLKSALTSGGALTFVAPQFPVLYTLAPLAVLDAADLRLAANTSPESRGHEWVFTPEVCLGPAYRSHAPPSLT